MNYSIEDFNFELPSSLIAQEPASPRNHARLLIYNRADKSLTDDYFYNLEKYLPKNATIVINNSKVEKCRLRFGKTELFVLETVNPTTIKALVYPGKKFKIGETVVGDFSFKVISIAEDGIRTIMLDTPLDDPKYDPFRLTPLPPYIAQDETLAEEYQTVYAKPLGSKAAPTAGLHFTAEQMEKIREKHAVAEIALHVGMGTFAPVKTSDVSKHVMHEEEYLINQTAANTLNTANHIAAVGTTSVRVLESATFPFCEEQNTTNIFITPGYEFDHVDSLITNFHLPKSTLLMLVSAFIGSVDELHRIYQHAIATKYRFYSFGDALLIL